MTPVAAVASADEELPDLGDPFRRDLENAVPRGFEAAPEADPGPVAGPTENRGYSRSRVVGEHLTRRDRTPRANDPETRITGSKSSARKGDSVRGRAPSR